MASQKYNILYGRLSQEDERQGESNSIHNQKLFLEKYAADNGFENTLFLADVEDGDVLNDHPAATYAYYQANIKPRPAAPAAESGKKRWVCTVCGYIYEGETLPADFICPICKHGVSDFEKLG